MKKIIITFQITQFRKLLLKTLGPEWDLKWNNDTIVFFQKEKTDSVKEFWPKIQEMVKQFDPQYYTGLQNWENFELRKRTVPPRSIVIYRLKKIFCLINFITV